jgi:sugar phosphate isomerase/epimerase
MKLAINGQQLGSTHSLEQVLDIIQGFDVHAVEFWPHNLTGGETDEEKQRYEKKDVAAAKRAVEARGMEVCCVTLGFNAMAVCSKSGGPENATAALQSAVDAAAELGAPIVNCYLAGISPDLFVQIVKPAAAYAGTKGVTIVLENEAHDDSATPEAVLDMVQRVGSPHFGTEYDPCNYYHAYEEPYPWSYEVLKDHIRYVHLKGGCYYNERWVTRQGSSMRSGVLAAAMNENDRFIGYLPLPDSAFNVDTILRRLAADGYSGYVTLEPHVRGEMVIDFYKVEVPYVRARLG